MTMKALSLLQFLLCVSLTALGQSICSQPHLAELVTKGTPAFGQKDFISKIQSSQVVIAGDVHFLTNQKAIADLILHFQKNHTKNACIAFELPVRKYGAEVFLNNLVEIIKEVEADKNYKSDSSLQDYAQSLMRLHAYYFPLSEYALLLNLKNKSVDHKDKWGQSMPMDVRNEAMSENIQSLFNSKECSAVLLIAGKAHLSVDLTQAQQTTRVQDLLKSKLKVTTINLQMTDESNIPQEIRSWQICEPTKNIKITSFSVLNNQVLQGQPKLTDRIKWKDFDFTLLIP